MKNRRKSGLPSNGQDLVIEVPPLTPDQLPCLHAWTIKITGAELRPEP